MRLDRVVVGDIVKASIGGRIIYGEVLEVREGTVRFTPISRAAGWSHATATQVVGHWRRTGEDGESVAQPPEQLSLRMAD